MRRSAEAPAEPDRVKFHNKKEVGLFLCRLDDVKRACKIMEMRMELVNVDPQKTASARDLSYMLIKANQSRGWSRRWGDNDKGFSPVRAVWAG